MSSGLSMALQFGLGNHAMTEDTLKQLLNIKDKIRDEHSESDMRNVIHSSDSWENARKESEIYF
jgi:nucleoside diphosphate kinase